MIRPVFALTCLAAYALAGPGRAGAQPALARAGARDTLQLSLEDAVATALRASDETRLAAAQTDVAEAQVMSARAGALPQLRVNTSYSHVYESARGNAVGSVFNQPNTYNVNAGITQPLFQGGRVVAGMRAAADTRSASRLDEQETRRRLTVDVQRAYLDALFSRRLAALQDSNVALASARVEQIEQLYAGGRAARYDVLRARVERANLEPLAIQAHNDRELAVLELRRLLNLPVDRPLELTTHVDADGVRALLPRLAALEDSAVVPDRAGLRSAELAARAQRENIAVARADFLPTASISFNTGYQAFPPLGYGLPDRFGRAAAEFCPADSPAGRVCQNGGWFSDRSLSATLSFPVFDGMRARSSLNVARAQARIAEIQLQQERETVALEVARARAELRRARAVYLAGQQNAGEAREAFQLASLRFSRGLSTQLEVSDAQLALLTAQSSEARATFDLYLASAELARALGRPIPFPPTAQSPSPRGSDDGADK
ncbi:MAG TPA: TolC family protein [Gemmatimonadaceae bacterium]|nr:TolC family protein [Gemmatimonadaceae bacterium]